MTAYALHYCTDLIRIILQDTLLGV